jgi:alpha-N-acetylglucosaminidase
MKYSRMFSIAAACLAWFIHPLCSADFIIAKDGKAEASISVNKKSAPTLQYAAEEFVKYIKLVSGAELNLKDEKTNSVIIGTFEETKKLIAEKTGKTLSFPSCPKEDDSFIIKTIKGNGKNYLLLAGASPRGVLYAVYGFLEKELNVGCFWCGINIPKTKSIFVSELDLLERPRFKTRQYPQECTVGYSMRSWNFEQWKRELDWMSWKRLNTFMLVHDDKQNVDMLGTSPKKVYDYARKLGMEIVLFFGPFDNASEKFAKANPGHKFIKVTWAGNPAGYVISPDDPLFKKRGKSLFESLVRTYGKNNIYKLHPFGEFRLQLPEAEITQTRIKYAQAMTQILNEVDPGGKFFIYGWPFSCAHTEWSKNDVEKFLKAFPKDKLYVGDAWGEENPTYKKYDYFYGREWVLGIIYLFGNMDFMKGNMEELCENLKRLSKDPRAKNCVGLDINPEITHYNEIYFGLLARLAWNPETCSLNNYLDAYTKRRYGKKVYNAMRKAIGILVDSAYNNVPGSEAIYRKRQRSSAAAINLLKDAEEKYCSNINSLRRALELFLSQKKELQNNACYQKDLVDIARQYIAELYNRHFFLAKSFYYQKDLKGFLKEKSILEILTLNLEKILSAHTPYQLRSMLDNEKDLKMPQKKFEKIIKDNTLTYASQEWLIDYSSKDIYELVKYYYAPRMEVFLDSLEKSLKNGKKAKDEKIFEAYRKIEKDWIEKPLASRKTSYQSNEKLCNIIDQCFKDIEKAGIKNTVAETLPLNKLKIKNSGQKTLIPSPAWEEDCKDMSEWKITYYKKGELKSKNGRAFLRAVKDSNICFGANVDLEIDQGDFLEFSFRQPNRLGENTFVLWVVWTDIHGKQRRNRIWQYPVENSEWRTVTLNLRKILSVISEPKSIDMIWLEGIAGHETEFEWIKLGKTGNEQ